MYCIYNGVKMTDYSALRESFLAESVVLPVKIAFTYFVFYYLFPLYSDRTQIFQLIGLSLMAFLVSVLVYRSIVCYWVIPWVNPGKNEPLFLMVRLFQTAFDIFITVAAASTVKMVRLHYQSRDYEQQLLREKLQSELKFLKAQTNPHFLFNTLNNLYVLAWKKSDKTAEAIMRLSKIMRFMLYDCKAPKIPLTEEAKVIRDYIELEKLRYSDRLTVNYRENIDDPDIAIAPLLLLPFVENSFKHGPTSTTDAASIDIDLQLIAHNLSFTVTNTRGEWHTAEPNVKGGIGMQNVRRQLDLIYPNHHQLTIQAPEHSYMIQLNIFLQ